jgi:hypothetical protein
VSVDLTEAASPLYSVEIPQIQPAPEVPGEGSTATGIRSSWRPEDLLQDSLVMAMAVESAEAPEPGSCLLLGGGLVALSLFGRYGLKANRQVRRQAGLKPTPPPR